MITKTVLLAAVAALSLCAGVGMAQAPAANPSAGWRDVDPDNVLVVETNKGRIIAELAPGLAPASVAQIKTLVRRHFYDGLTFFRVVDGFMDQTGDPKNTGEGASDLPNVGAEFMVRRGPETPMVRLDPNVKANGFIGAMPAASQPDALMAMMADGKVMTQASFCKGVLGMARASAPDSANSQFFFMRDTVHRLDGQYTPFGRVLFGLDAVRAIKVGEPVVDPQDKIVTARLLSDLPPAGRPTVRVLDTASPQFRALFDAARAAKGVNFDACDLDIPVSVQ